MGAGASIDLSDVRPLEHSTWADDFADYIDSQAEWRESSSPGQGPLARQGDGAAPLALRNLCEEFAFTAHIRGRG